jgi:glycosyltransferase involved in cell wall biosynthesis
VLFVTHQASRTGAPIALLRLIQWLRSNTSLRMEVVVQNPASADMLPEFLATCPTRVLTWTLPVHRRALVWLLRRLGRAEMGRAVHHRFMSRQFRGVDSRVIYLNSAASARSLRFLPRAELMIGHVHELEFNLDHLVTDADLRAFFAECRRLVVPSQAVRDLAVTKYGCNPDDVVLCPSFVMGDAPTSAEIERLRKEGRRRLGFTEEEFVVCGSGSLNWFKAPEVFLLVAARLRQLSARAAIRFIWVGGQAGTLKHDQLAHDVAKLDLDGVVAFVEAVADPAPLYAAADVFLLTSREDSMGLVAVESALLRRPIVAFESGGIADLVEGDAGVVVSYLNIEAMAQALHKLMQDPATRTRMGEVGAARVGGEFHLDVVGPRILQLLSPEATD